MSTNTDLKTFNKSFYWYVPDEIFIMVNQIWVMGPISAKADDQYWTLKCRMTAKHIKKRFKVSATFDRLVLSVGIVVPHQNKNKKVMPSPGFERHSTKYHDLIFQYESKIENLPNACTCTFEYYFKK